MVYCGKASQGCQNCRTRRIKCDKVRPHCSQCLRVGKNCPGYRDQLSLMFRDESDKVIQKAHAQWGVGSPPDHAPSASSSPSSSFSASSEESSRSEWLRQQSTEVAAVVEQHHHMVKQHNRRIPNNTIYMKVEPTLEQKGINFFLDRYLLGHPDAPSDPEQMEPYDVNNQGAMVEVMMAVGLAGLANKKGDRSLLLLSRYKYTSALRKIGQLLASGSTNPRAMASAVRAAVSLALFEVVHGRGSKPSVGVVSTHITGAIGLMQAAFTTKGFPPGGAKALLQIVFSLFIPQLLAEKPLAPSFYDTISLCEQNLPVEERCSCDLAISIAHFIDLSASLKGDLNLSQLSGKTRKEPPSSEIIDQIIEIDNRFAKIGESLVAAYPYRIVQTNLPKIALFHGKHHQYDEIWAARLWNHYRWIRITSGLKILELTGSMKPGFSSLSLGKKQGILKTMRDMAEDILISTPCHWHHPALNRAQAKAIEAPGKGGSGAAGTPTLLWHLTVSSCVPGAPREFWDWAQRVMEVVWKDMGMKNALALSEVMDGRRTNTLEKTLDRIEKSERENMW